MPTADTRVDELENEIRVVCEPIFDRPLEEISLGKVLMQLFRASLKENVTLFDDAVVAEPAMCICQGLEVSDTLRVRVSAPSGRHSV